MHSHVNASMSESTLLEHVDHVEQEPKIRNWQAMMSIIKTSIGTGILAMPVAFLNSGVFGGLISMFVIGLFVIYSLHQIVNCVDYLEKKHNIPEIDYGELCQVAFQHYKSEAWRKFGRIFKQTCNGFIIVTMLGANCIYLLLMAQNIKQVVEAVAPSFVLAVQVYELMVLVPLLLFVFMRHLHGISYMTLFANVVIVFCLIVIFQYVLQQPLHVWTLPAFADIGKLPLTFGTSIFAFECITLVLPVRNRMHYRDDFAGWTGVLNVGMIIVVCLFTAVGFYGYLCFGEKSNIILLNLPQDTLYLVVRLLYLCALYVSFGLLFYVPVSILYPSVWRLVNRRWTSSGRLPLGPHKQRIVEYIFRSILLMFIYAAAAGIPYLDLIISLIGSVCVSCLGIIFPCALELAVFFPDMWFDGSVSPLRRWFFVGKIAVIMTFGLVGFGTGTYVSVLGIVQKFSNSTS